MIIGDVVLIGERSQLEYRHIRAEWAGELESLERSSFPTADHDDLYHDYEFEALARDYPTGCFVGFDGDHAVAMGVGVRYPFDIDEPLHTIHDVMPTDGSSGHDPAGDWYYGTSIAVRPEYRRRGIGNELYGLRKGVCIEENLRGIVAGGVIPGYAEHKGELTADEYIAKVRDGELYDRTLSFQLSNGFEAPCALPDYIVDPNVDDHAALIIWHNPSYREVTP